MDDLIERARAAAQHSREFGPGTNAPLLDDLADALEAVREDGARLDWLSDRDQHIGNVMLPTHIVEANVHSLRAALSQQRAVPAGTGWISRRARTIGACRTQAPGKPYT